MRHVILAPDASQADIYAAISELREKQRTACIPSTAAEYGDDIDELLERLTGH